MHFFQKKCQDDQSIDEDSNDDDDFENLSWIDEKTYEILTQILQALVFFFFLFLFFDSLSLFFFNKKIKNLEIFLGFRKNYHRISNK